MRMNDTFSQVGTLSDLTIQLAKVTDLKVWAGKPAYADALQVFRRLYEDKKDDLAIYELYDIKKLLAVIKRCDTSYRTQQCCNRMIYVVDTIVKRLKACNCDAICRNCDATHEGRYLDQRQRRYVEGV